jgi:phosphohistidine phosphatase SixA
MLRTLALGCLGFVAIAACAGNPSVETSDTSPPPPSPSETAAPETPSTGASPEAESIEVAAELNDALWAQLQQAETRYFVLMRHALAPGTGDPANFQVDDCSTQRNLDEAGREQARRTGEAFRQRNIPVSQVLSSQWCRCLETAELLNLGAVEPFPALNSFFQDRSTAEAQTQEVQEFMRNSPNQPGVTVMVTHFVNISALSGSGVTSGAMVVMQVNDDDQVEVVGQIEAF